MQKKLKILEVTSFSSGFCGIWFRVQQEAQLLSQKGYDVYIFSSNIHRGSGKIEYAPKTGNLGKVKILRFKTKRKIGENSFFWNYTQEVLKLKPDVIICHAYRQYYSTLALKIAKKLKIPCILVTHAPFIDRKTRGLKLTLIAKAYDFFIGRNILNKYSKIFAISKWEIPYLKNLGVRDEKIIYSPNGIPEEFFTTPLKKNDGKNKKILFLGRIAPIKDLITLILAFNECLKKKPDLILDIVGPEEEEYNKIVKNLISSLKIEKNIIFHGPVFDIRKKIELIDKADLFVLPSKREGMPQSLIEAMSRKKIVISSDTLAGKDLVKDNYNGYLFKIGDFRGLSKKIFLALEENQKNQGIKKKARESVKRFSWNLLAEQTDKIIKKEIELKKCHKNLHIV